MVCPQQLFVLLVVVVSSSLTHELAQLVHPRIPGDVMCPDGQHACSFWRACCMLPSGKWGCCPIPNGVCCKDSLHCCPQNTNCDTVHGRCNKRTRGVERSVPWLKKMESREVHLTLTEAAEVNYKAIICPDQRSYCPDGSTCCVLPTGGSGCCQMPKANCCKDHLHCCPHDSICDLEHSACRRKRAQRNDDLTSLLVKTLAGSMSSLLNKDVCHDKQTLCINGYKCCITVDDKWECCKP